jgi:WD40 repeat protein
MLVVVGTERAATRQTIADEVREFLQTGRSSSVVPVDFGGAVYRANWYSLVEGIAPEPEKNPLALDDGEPSPSVLSRIEKQFNYTRRNQRLRRGAIGMAVVFAVLLLAGVGAGVYARQQIVLANAERERAGNARALADAAQRDAATERDKALVAKGEADQARTEATEQKSLADAAADAAHLAEVRAGDAAKREQVARELEAKATANARVQETIASSRAKATAAMRFAANEPDHALTESVEAYRLHPTVEARGSLLTSLELYPNLSGVAREDPNPIESLASCHDGAVLVSSDDTRLVLFWDAARRRVLKRVEPPHGNNYGVRIACMSGGSVCAADYSGGELSVWEVEARGEGYEVIQRASLKSPTQSIVPIAPVFAAPNLLVTIGEGNRLRRTQQIALVDTSGAAPLLAVKTLSFVPNVTPDDFGTARTLAASPATKTIAIGYNHGVALWQIDALDKPADWVRHPEGWNGSEYITANLSFSPDGQYLAVSAKNGDVLVWDLGEEGPKMVEKPHADVGTYVTLFNSKLERWPEGTYMVTAKATGEMSLWHIWNETTVWMRTFGPGVRSIIPMNGTGLVATGSNDGLLALWDMGLESRMRQSLAGVDYPTAFAFGKSSGLLYAASGTEGDSGSRLWREERGRYELFPPGERRPEFPAGEFGLQLLPDESSEYIAVREVYGGTRGEFRLSIKHTLKCPRAVSPDGRMLAVAESPGTITWDISKLEPTSIGVWDISDTVRPRKMSSLDFDGRPVSLAFGGATLAASYDNGRVVLWDYSKGMRLRQFIVPGAYEPGSGRKYNAGRVALNPNGQLLAAKSDGPVSLWDVETGVLLGRFGPEKYPFRLGEDYPSDFMVFSRDGKALVIAHGGSSSGVVDLWNLDPKAWAAMASKLTGQR